MPLKQQPVREQAHCRSGGAARLRHLYERLHAVYSLRLFGSCSSGGGVRQHRDWGG